MNKYCFECKILFRILNCTNDLVLDENKTKIRLQLRNFITKGRAASALEVTGPQHKKV